jgi:hypothetical protein
MQTFACPNCGADVSFRSPALPVRICDHCQSMIVRTGDALNALGKAAVLPFDVSPIMIGTRGRFEDRPFEVIGRVRWGWTDGSWNEWLLLFDDGSDAWLGEAMGQYMLLRERALGDLNVEALEAIASGEPIPVGNVAIVDGETLTVADARDAVCIAAEGELPFSAPAGWSVYSVDFRTPSGRCATVQREGSEMTFYDGRYVTLAELAPKGLRAIEGWSMPEFGTA